MPIGVIVRELPSQYEAVANGDPGMPLGRELEIADLLRFIRDGRIRNVVWITADVHYCAAHRYDPARARFTDPPPRTCAAGFRSTAYRNYGDVSES
jgi:alkaline phosphatase D